MSHERQLAAEPLLLKSQQPRALCEFDLYLVLFITSSGGV